MSLSSHMRRYTRLGSDSWRGVSRFGGGAGILWGGMEYLMARGQGMPVSYSLGRAAVMGSMWAFAPGAMMTYFALSSVGGIAGAATRGYLNRQSRIRGYSKAFNRPFLDNPYAQQERSMLMQEMSQSAGRVGSILGREARFFANRYG